MQRHGTQDGQLFDLWPLNGRLDISKYFGCFQACILGVSNKHLHLKIARPGHLLDEIR